MAYAQGDLEVHISRHPSDDMDGPVRVFDHDAQKHRVLNGWLWEFGPIEEAV